jgi:hypothetical protein
MLIAKHGGILMAKMPAARMSVRILDKKGDEIISFFSDKPAEDEGGFSAGLRDSLLAFRRNTQTPALSMLNFKDD